MDQRSLLFFNSRIYVVSVTTFLLAMLFFVTAEYLSANRIFTFWIDRITFFDRRRPNIMEHFLAVVTFARRVLMVQQVVGAVQVDAVALVVPCDSLPALFTHRNSSSVLLALAKPTILSRWLGTPVSTLRVSVVIRLIWVGLFIGRG